MEDAKSGLQSESVLVLDFGSQFVQLIARRVREQGVYCEIVRNDLPASRIRERNPRGLILSGGPMSVYEQGAPRCDPDIFNLGLPILGVCYGMQLACESLGGKVESHPSREFGRTELEIVAHDPLLAGVPSRSTVWMSHGDQVAETSADFVPLARTANCRIAAVKHRSRPVYGLQFHPEVSHTPWGATILGNFVRAICGCRASWKLDDFLERQVALIRERVGRNRVICGLSGGVDSAVAAAMIHRAVGEQLTCIFVDNGLLRLGERESVESTFRGHFHVDLRVVDASELFLQKLRGVVDPQRKRELIGHAFVEVFRREAQSIPNARFLAQGTLYPDVIESGASVDGPAATIKTHHNVGGLPADLGFELIEPLRDLFKDEVRRIGDALGIPKRMLDRHPFPGPGLAVRCLGEVRSDRLEVLRRIDAIFLEELENAGSYNEVAQAFAVLLPVQSVGVMGDGRTYESVAALRAVTTDDFMTADWARLDFDLLAKIATRVINEVRGVNRVVYDISTKPPATIEWE